jgi:hypothetical protein
MDVHGGSWTSISWKYGWKHACSNQCWFMKFCGELGILECVFQFILIRYLMLQIMVPNVIVLENISTLSPK